MDIRIEKLIESFQNNGWRLIGSVDSKESWWFEDILLLQSTWRPVGKKLYLTLLTDPQINNKKVVWCLSLSLASPERSDLNSLEQITLSNIKKTRLEDFVKRINSIVLVEEH